MEADLCHNYILSIPSLFKQDIYKIGMHTGSREKLCNRYITSLPDLVIFYFHQCDQARWVEQEILQEYEDKRIINSRGHLSEWIQCNIYELQCLIDMKISCVSQSSDVTLLKSISRPKRKHGKIREITKTKNKKCKVSESKLPKKNLNSCGLDLFSQNALKVFELNDEDSCNLNIVQNYSNLFNLKENKDENPKYSTSSKEFVTSVMQSLPPILKNDSKAFNIVFLLMDFLFTSLHNHFPISLQNILKTFDLAEKNLSRRITGERSHDKCKLEDVQKGKDYIINPDILREFVRGILRSLPRNLQNNPMAYDTIFMFVEFLTNSSHTQFPVSLEVICEKFGLSNRNLKRSFDKTKPCDKRHKLEDVEEGRDYIKALGKKGKRGPPREDYYISLDLFARLMMQSHSRKARIIQTCYQAIEKLFRDCAGEC